MLYADLLNSQGETLLVLVLLLLLLLAGEAGYRYGRKNRPMVDDLTRAQVLTIQGAVLGLLGLLLGFTFAMAVSRFDSRKQLAVDEANALGMTYLRARLLPEPPRAEVAPLLRRYVAVRLEMARADPESPAAAELAKKLAGLQELLWAQAVAAAEKDRRAVSTGLFTQSLNEALDLAGKRESALENHVPESVLYLLCFAAAVSVGVVGYGCGLGSGRTLLPMLALSGLIAVVVLLIVDLDRPRHGLIQISEQSLRDLEQSWGRQKQ